MGNYTLELNTPPSLMSSCCPSRIVYDITNMKYRNTISLSLGFEYGPISSLIQIGLRMPFFIGCKPAVSPETKLRIFALYTINKMH